MRLILELAFVGGLGAVAASAMALALIGLSFPWKLSESERSQPYVELSRQFGRGSVGIRLYRHRVLWLRLALFGVVALVASGAVMLLVWGE